MFILKIFLGIIMYYLPTYSYYLFVHDFLSLTCYALLDYINVCFLDYICTLIWDKSDSRWSYDLTIDTKNSLLNCSINTLTAFLSRVCILSLYIYNVTYNSYELHCVVWFGLLLCIMTCVAYHNISCSLKKHTVNTYDKAENR